ncbi:MAG: electron transfer flavoprotein subunit beta/FixA family protein [Leptospiraceae bacterium]|nr:electron transfer flavoprotein subunit beta/FixA family protein [Leptospiraceae bacterium]MCB1200726.1 electron transfer flavoprotein subunit beta/FixA family protein [Leptospiraceae bacterium]
MDILVLIKQVPDTEAKITVSGNKINEAGVSKWIISPYDEIALEEAIRIKEKSGGTVTAISVGDDSVQASLRQAFAMGADTAIQVKTDSYQMLDSFGIAEALLKAIEGKEYKVILAGRQGSDSDNGQVPLIMATLKDWGVVPFAKKVELKDDKAIIECEAEGGDAVYESSYPVVVTANAGLNEPRYPSLKGIMASKKKPIEVKNISELGVSGEARIEVVGFEPPPPRPAGRVIDGADAAEKAKALVKALAEEIKAL